MRDILLCTIIFGSIPFILRRPAIGVFMWVWVSVMSPHRLAYGFAFDMPFAMVIAIATGLGMLFSTDKGKLPLNGITITLILLTIWMTVTTIFALHPDEAWGQWRKVGKIQIMNLVCLYVLASTKQHIQILVAICAMSIGFYGVKGGLFTLRGGGGERVWGPSGSFIGDNNALALAIVMVIPLIYYLGTQMRRRSLKWGFFGAMALCALSALGSHSRGGLLAIAAMGVFLWLKSKSKLKLGVVLIALSPLMFTFMPEKWYARMHTIETYEADDSAMGRINAWRMTLNLIKDRPLVGGGFDAFSLQTYARYAPDSPTRNTAHSIYFQMLGEHGITGLIIFIMIFFLAWRTASGVIKRCRGHPEMKWASDLCAMVQVGIVGYAVGGAFLNLAYFDLPYYMVSIVVLARIHVERALAGKDDIPKRDSAGRLVRPSGLRNADRANPA